MLVQAVIGKIPKMNNAIILSFDEMFEKYKLKCKKAYWRTIEGFYLDWINCDTIKQLKQCKFIIPDNEEVAKLIRNKYKVLDENDY